MSHVTTIQSGYPSVQLSFRLYCRDILIYSPSVDRLGQINATSFQVEKGGAHISLLLSLSDWCLERKHVSPASALIFSFSRLTYNLCEGHDGDEAEDNVLNCRCVCSAFAAEPLIAVAECK